MIEKIISGGQTGVDRAALDAAIALSIPHGGWLPKGRKTEDGPLPERYLLQEMPSASYQDRTVRNVMDSDGTLIISRGALTGGSALTQTAAATHEKPCLHVDLKQMPGFLASSQVVDWLIENHVEILNVAGPRASKDHRIYSDARKIIEGVYYLSLVKANSSIAGSLPPSRPAGHRAQMPDTVEAAVDQIISEMPLKDRATLANMTEREVLSLRTTLGRYMSEKLDLWISDSGFVASYRELSGHTYEKSEALVVMMRELWIKLKATHKLRIVK